MSRSRSRIRPPVGQLEAADHAQRRRLAAARRAEQREELAGGRCRARRRRRRGRRRTASRGRSRRISGEAAGGSRHRADVTRPDRAARRPVLSYADAGTLPVTGDGPRSIPDLRDSRGRQRARLRPRRDALERALPAGVERLAGLVEVDDDRRVVRRDRRALARLAVDLGPDDALRDRRGRVQQVDPHALVAVEHAGPVVPPREPAGLRPLRTGRRPRGPTRAGGPAPRAPARRHVRPAVRLDRAPDVLVGRGHVVVAAQDQRLVGRAASRRASGRRARTSAACPRRTGSRRPGRSAHTG